MGGSANTAIVNLQLNRVSMSKFASYTCVYDSSGDILYIRPETPLPAVSLDWNGEIWLRLDPSSSELVGIEIGDFESIFLKKHPELATVWQQYKPRCKRKDRKRTRDGDWETFVRIIIEFLSSLFAENPQQL